MSTTTGSDLGGAEVIEIDCVSAQKKGGRPVEDVLKHFDRGPYDKSKNCYATCKGCRRHWKRARLPEIRLHLAKECTAIAPEVSAFYKALLAKDAAASSSEVVTAKRACSGLGSQGSKRGGLL
ncbi:hypothetical protein VOLCADRAFT_97269 [Volvox carteri f. nagariensis]|uniref:BED-type domain-containing protein n=1 Tax=Volvox carteri f. nagariensis TaxID=3068 RepID=D8UCA9_VOLCA|nr:uncharacterized protein VOLCADRAFT_97269 [Volvox carteri f. nagariensis]EFJ42667.1 hypothetical protein VOLCADRAFT_97269 [Volvox carteri f. nagariensis]|eukprot:XP_002956318.1 hypothetical protein VOLCADRAFT_97269 [Volvox carteri f. nagariensis]